MVKFQGIFIVISIIHYGLVSSNYCDVKECGKAKHIACNNNGKFSDDCPSDAELVRLSAAEKNLLLNLHNDKRNAIAGGEIKPYGAACRMAKMRWSNELEKLAELNVKQCKLKHDACRATKNFPYPGQNLAWVGYYPPKDNDNLLKRSFSMWFEEHKVANESTIQSFPTNFQGLGHFTATVQEKTTHLGCAASTYSMKGKPFKAYLVTCNYAMNNIIGRPVYTTCPKPGSKCEQGTDNVHNNLCSLSERYHLDKFY